MKELWCALGRISVWGWMLRIFILIGVALFLIITFNKAYFNTSWEIDTKLAADFGSFIGGFVGTIFSALSVFLIIYTFNRQSLFEQKNAVTNNFFKMLDCHNSIVEQVVISNDKKEECDKERRAFNSFRNQINYLSDEFMDKDILSQTKLEETGELEYIFFYYYRSINEMEAVVEHLAASFFYGKENEYNANLKNEKRNLSNFFQKNKDRLCEIMNGNAELNLNNEIYLSSYFKNLYNAIKLMDDNEVLSNEEKENLIYILRARLSNPELYLLNLHSQSIIGKRESQDKWRAYIDRYNFMENIPPCYLYCDRKKDRNKRRNADLDKLIENVWLSFIRKNSSVQFDELTEDKIASYDVMPPCCVKIVEIKDKNEGGVCDSSGEYWRAPIVRIHLCCHVGGYLSIYWMFSDSKKVDKKNEDSNKTEDCIVADKEKKYVEILHRRDVKLIDRKDLTELIDDYVFKGKYPPSLEFPLKFCEDYTSQINNRSISTTANSNSSNQEMAIVCPLTTYPIDKEEDSEEVFSGFE